MSKLTDLQDQITILDTNWKRALADYQNLLRRVETDKKEFMKMSNANLIARLLPSLDIIDMAVTHTKDLGVEMAAKQFRQALTEDGLQEVSPAVGDSYDHLLHEAIEIIETTDPTQTDTVSELVLKGYKIGEYVMRPAKVKVFKLEEAKLALDN